MSLNFFYRLVRAYHTPQAVHTMGSVAVMAKKKVFVSFDFDNDKALKVFIIGQARLPDSPFEVIDTSLKEAAPMKTWEDKARAAIKRSDIVLVMVGPLTYKAPGVLKEVAMSREEVIPIVQVIGLSFAPLNWCRSA